MSASPSPELKALRRDGVDPVLLSTWQSLPELISHEWSEEAMARTIYVVRMGPVAALAGLLCLPKSDILQAFKSGSLEHVKHIVLALPAARRLLGLARQKGIVHVHAHSCGRATLIVAMAHRMGGPNYSLALHGPLHEYGPGQRYRWQHAAFATVIALKLLNEIQALLAEALPSVVEIQAMVEAILRLEADPVRARQIGEAGRRRIVSKFSVAAGAQTLVRLIQMSDRQLFRSAVVAEKGR